MQPLRKTVWRLLKNLERVLPRDSAIPLLSVCSKGISSLLQRNIRIPISITALFTIAKLWEQPKSPCPSTDEWVKKMWYILIYVYITQWVIYTTLVSREREGNLAICNNTDGP